MSDTDNDVFDPNQADNYARHLAKVNQSKKVIATHDILNDQNAILVKAGAQIDARTTERIVKFKLLRPLEESVVIEGDIDDKALLASFNDIIAASPVAHRIHHSFKLDALISALCRYYKTLPILRQKITVLSMQLPGIYQRTLASTWIATMIGNQMRLPTDELEALFIAAIAHDIGMLHISEAVVNKPDPLTPEEWRQIYAHPIIGEKILSNIDNIAPTAVRAVREHQEYCDGTGYPAGRRGKDLHPHGQIIAMADTVTAVLSRMHHEKKGRGLRDLLPILQISSHAHFAGIYNAFILVLKKADLGNDGVIADDDMPAFIDQVVQTDKRLSVWFNAAHRPLAALDNDHQDRKLSAIQTVITNISTAVRGAGILDEGYLRFLAQVKADGLRFAYREVEDVALMLEELHFQFNRLTRLIRDYLEFQHQANARVVEMFNQILKSFETIDSVL